MYAAGKNSGGVHNVGERRCACRGRPPDVPLYDTEKGRDVEDAVPYGGADINSVITLRLPGFSGSLKTKWCIPYFRFIGVMAR